MCSFSERNRKVKDFNENIKSHPFADSEISYPYCCVKAKTSDISYVIWVVPRFVNRPIGLCAYGLYFLYYNNLR